MNVHKIITVLLGIAFIGLFYMSRLTETRLAEQIRGQRSTIVRQQVTIVDLNQEIYELRTALGINYSGE